MANISSASGTITLVGNWTQEALDAFLPVLKSWEFYGQYGIQWCGGLSLKNRTADFSGCGRWAFSGTLESFDDWTRDWIKNHPETDHPLTDEEYDNFLKIMSDNNLSIEINFVDEEEGMGFRLQETGTFTSDGESLTYETISCEDKETEWDDLGVEYFDAAVEFFSYFAPSADEREIGRWVFIFIEPTNMFYEIINYSDWDYDGYIAENMDYMEILPIDQNAVIDFQLRFSPIPEKWHDFLECLQEYYAFFFGEDVHNLDISDQEIDELDMSDEDFTEWYEESFGYYGKYHKEPEYDTDEIDSLDFKGKRFVLTGEFQNAKESRDEIKELIEKKGGKCTGAVSGKTNYLVLGDFGDVGARKVEEANAQKAVRDDIKIISESDLFRFL